MVELVYLLDTQMARLEVPGEVRWTAESKSNLVLT